MQTQVSRWTDGWTNCRMDGHIHQRMGDWLEGWRTDGDTVVVILVLTALDTLSETLSLHHLQQTDGTRLLLVLHSPGTQHQWWWWLIIDTIHALVFYIVSFYHIALTKRATGIPLITVEYHSVSFSTIGLFNDISAGLSGTLSSHL